MDEEDSNVSQSRILDWSGFPGRWTITRSAGDTDGEFLEMQFEIESATGDSPFLHAHPHAQETYRVVSGALEVNVEGEWEEVSAGETHTVPPGTAHTFRNRTPVEVVNVHRPALDFERFFRRFHRLVTERDVGLPPKSFRSVLLLAMLITEHETEVVSVKPPQSAMRVLAFIGRLIGYRLPEWNAPSG